jgi:hypothetical protein
MLFVRGRYPDAAVRYEEAARLLRDAADQKALPWTLAMGSLAEIYQGRNEVAVRMLQEGEAVGRRIDEIDAVMFSRGLRGFVAGEAGQLAEAEQIIESGEPEARARCAPWTLAALLTMRLRITVRMGEYGLAKGLARQVISILGRLRDTWLMMNALRHLAAADSLSSNPRRAAQLFGAADALIERYGSATAAVSQEFNEQCRLAVAQQLGQEDYQALLKEGSVLSLDEVVALAIDPGPGS